MELRELSALVDEFYRTREERLAADRVAKRLKEQETDLQTALITAMGVGEVGSVGGTLCRVTRQTKMHPVAQDWSLVYSFVIKNEACDILQKRLHEGAVALRWEDKIVIPGIEAMPVNTLSVSKL